jgi:hypothetical protein
MAEILTDPLDYTSIRTKLGLDELTLSDDQIIDTYLEGVEADIADALVLKGVTLSVTEIMAGTNPANAADKTHLIEAARNLAAYKVTPMLPTALNTSETVGPETQDAGATQGWKDQAGRFQAECDRELGKITGFRRWRTL